YGSADNPEQFPFLYAYSPYHHVKAGTKYPAVLFITGDSDTRVAPLHARKMAALLQASTASDWPVILHYDTKAGHSGGATPVSKALRSLGHDVRVAIPGYGAIDWAGIAPTPRARLDVQRSDRIETAEIFEATVEGVAFVLITGPPIPKDGRIYGSGMSEDGPQFLF